MPSTTAAAPKRVVILTCGMGWLVAGWGSKVDVSSWWRASILNRNQQSERFFLTAVQAIAPAIRFEPAMDAL